MTWYKTGTVTVTPGSNAVIGVGTAFIRNSRVGDAFRGPDGEWYEVANVASDTALAIDPPYQGAAVSDGFYSIAPMQGYNKDSGDALREATRAISGGVVDMEEQVAAATGAAESASQSKAVATEQAGISTGAAGVASDSKNAAQLAAQQSQSSAQASGLAADQAETAKNSIIQSEQAAAASAAAAADSAAQAEQVTIGKADKGANSDITSLSGLTTALSINQGGTGGKTAAEARAALELKTGALAAVTTSNTDATADRVMRPGNFGIGSYDPIIVPDANAIRMTGFYYGAGSANTPETYGFIQHQGAGAQDGLQRFMSAVTRIEYKRILSSGVWGAWDPGAAASPITKSFTTAQQNFVGAGQFVVSHGMGVKPRIIQAWFVCVVADAGYAVGDSMPYPEFGTDSGGATGLSCVSTSTTVTVRMGASQFVVLQKASGAAIFVTAANWRIYLELFA